MSIFKTKYLLGIIVCILLTGCTYNNIDEIKMKNWKYLNTKNSNLSGDGIIDMKIDSKGNIWVLCSDYNFDYLNKIYPDLHIEAFKIPFSDSISTYFKSANVIAIDGQDRIWVGARTSPFYCLENNSWKKFFFNVNFSEVSAMAFDEKNNLWFGSPYNGLFNNISDSTLVWNHLNSSIPSPEVIKLLVKKSDEVFFFTNQSPPIIGSKYSLTYFDGNNFKVLNTGNEILAFNYFSTMTLNGNKELAVLAKDKKIYELTNNQFYVYNKNNYPLNFKYPRGLIFDKESGYWLITENGLFNYKLDQVKHYSKNNSGINNLNLSSIVISKENKMFVGTFGYGINIFSNY